MINHTIIIAEAGVNHNGDLNLAKKLVDVAAEAGADMVKFQTFKAENIAIQSAPKAKYQIENTSINQSQFDILKNLELTSSMHEELIIYCKKKKSLFFHQVLIFIV